MVGLPWIREIDGARWCGWLGAGLCRVESSENKKVESLTKKLKSDMVVVDGGHVWPRVEEGWGWGGGGRGVRMKGEDKTIIWKIKKLKINKLKLEKLIITGNFGAASTRHLSCYLMLDATV